MADAPSADPLISYATPLPERTSYWPAAILCLSGLGLIGTGGCFLIGVLVLNSGGPTQGGPLNAHQVLLMAVLYALAACCFAGAVLMFILGVRRLR